MGLSLFSQIQDGFEEGSGIITPASYYFILYLNINNNNN